MTLGLLRVREKSTFSESQRTTLEQAYRCKPYVDYQRRMELAMNIGLSEEQVLKVATTILSVSSIFGKVLLGRTRTFERYSSYQRSQLEQEYQRSRFISYERKAELAQRLSLSKTQVQFWFQNRRSKEKKLLQKNMTSFQP